jgi:hypothetical protein
MDFAHQTKKKKTLKIAEQKKGPQKTASHGYPFTSFWDFLQQCDSIHPLLRKIEYP